MRENRLAATHIRQGRDVVLIPLYTPIRTDEADVSTPRVYYGGLNVFLQQKYSLMRHMPRAMGRLLDSPTLLRWITRWGMKTKAKDLGALTVSVMRGAQGAQNRELEKLIDGLVTLKPSLVNLPNLMFVGAARAIKQALGIPVICTLAGEDAFLDALLEPYRSEAYALIRQGAEQFDGFIAPTKYYARRASEHFGLPAQRVHYVPMGICVDEFAQRETKSSDEFTIGYLAAVCPEKGLAQLCDAFALLRKQGRKCRLRIAGYVSAAGREYWAEIQRTLRASRIMDAIDFVGEVDAAQKRSFLQSLDLFCVPTAHPEPKGFYVLEALASGVPVVQPRHGSFLELIEDTGGGRLYDPDGPQSLATAMAELMDDAPLRDQLATTGRASVRELHSDTRMADETWALYERLAH